MAQELSEELNAARGYCSRNQGPPLISLHERRDATIHDEKINKVLHFSLVFVKFLRLIALHGKAGPVGDIDIGFLDLRHVFGAWPNDLDCLWLNFLEAIT